MCAVVSRESFCHGSYSGNEAPGSGNEAKVPIQESGNEAPGSGNEAKVPIQKGILSGFASLLLYCYSTASAQPTSSNLFLGQRLDLNIYYYHSLFLRPTVKFKKLSTPSIVALYY
jgi:hypothetical protein